MIRVLLIDDEPLASDLVAEYLLTHADYEIVGRCLNGFEGFKAIQELRPDLVFLDVQMPKINGFELLEMLDNPPAIIFTTAFDAFALKAFEANAVDYLLKPFSEERFADALAKYQQRRDKENSPNLTALKAEVAPQNTNRVVVKDGGKIRILPVKEILRLEADGDYVTIFSTSGRFTLKKSLQHFEQRLSDSVFARVHRTHLLNVSAIERIDPYGKNSHLAQLKNGDKIPVSRSGYQRLKQTLNL
jgi:two-component system LytT family response regulator